MDYSKFSSLQKLAESGADAEAVDQQETIINATPHALNICDEAGEIVDTIPAPIDKSQIARVSSTATNVGTLRGYNVVRTEYGDVEGLEEETPGVVYLVSAMVGQVLAGKRNDIYSPDTGATAVRNNGQIVGVRQFIKW